MKFEIRGIQFSTKEIKQLTISLVVLSFAFSLVLYREKIFVDGFNYAPIFFLNSLIVVGLAFILHEELGHKIVAQRFGYWAEYRAWPMGLFIALITSFMGFVFAAPGAVMISARTTHHRINNEKMGKIAVAGSVVNIILCFIFVALSLIFNSELFSMAAWINAFLALFNMIPIGMLDGAKVLKWNKGVWVSVLSTSVILFLFSGSILNSIRGI